MKSRVFTLLLGSVVLASVSSANLVVNGSFEVPNQGGGWGQSNDDGIVAWYAEVDLMEVGSAGTYGVTGQTGLQVLELDAKANAKISQNLTTLAAQDYTLSFDAALRANVALASQGLDVLWNDVVVGSFLPGSTAMSSYSLVVTGTGADKLSFQGTGTSDSFGSLVDNVAVEAVPEPGTMAALAFGAAAMARRRKRA